MIEYYIHSLYVEEDVHFRINHVRQSLYEIYENCVATHKSTIDNASEENLQPSGRGGDSASGTSKGKNIVGGREAFDNYINRMVDTIKYVKCELDVYMQEGVYTCS